ncbi:MAG: hypothetical protein RBR53_10935 [Desulforegulaceae bacterium]|nr:hypothetical protein [Desulforegulaceae bacterium]
MENSKEDDNKKIILSTIKKYNKKNQYIPIKNNSIEIESNKNIYKLIRISDEEYSTLRCNSVQIKEDFMHFMSLSRSKDLIYPSLSKMYTILKDLFGESGEHYDDWKCSFCFPFLMQFKYKDVEFEYLMKVIDIKGGIEIIFYKMAHEDDEECKRKEIIYRSFEELPEDEMIYIMNYFAGYMTGVFSNFELLYNTFYFKTISSLNIVYGYKQPDFFDESFETDEEYHSFVCQMEAIQNNLKNKPINNDEEFGLNKQKVILKLMKKTFNITEQEQDKILSELPSDTIDRALDKIKYASKKNEVLDILQ